MTTFIELSDEEYAALPPIQKAHYKKAYNKFHGIVKQAVEEDSDSNFVSKKMLREAIRDKCMDCTCDQRTEIKLCPVTKCPLWKYRPFQKIKVIEIVDTDSEAV